MADTQGAAFGLEQRQGVSDEIAHLRATFPRDGWRGHARFGQLADFWLSVHAGLRREGAAVSATVDAFRARRTDAQRFGQTFVPLLNGFLGHVDQHHRIEDHAYFPKFRQLDPRMAAGFDLLDADHAILHQRLEAIAQRARELLGALAMPGDAARAAADLYAGEASALQDLLLRHLADEEDIVIPAMLKYGERPLR